MAKEKKIKIDASFEQLVKESVSGNPSKKVIPRARLMPDQHLKIFAARIDNIPVRFYRENIRQYSIIVTKWEIGFMVNKNDAGDWEVVPDSPNNPLNKQVDFYIKAYEKGTKKAGG